jgi:hypothetical protein
MTHSFRTVWDAMAWMAGYRYLSHAPMDAWFKQLRVWRDGETLLMSLPIGVLGHCVASGPLSATGDMTDAELAEANAFAECFTGNQAAVAEFKFEGHA